jgi:hypothetical protein
MLTVQRPAVYWRVVKWAQDAKWFDKNDRQSTNIELPVSCNVCFMLQYKKEYVFMQRQNKYGDKRNWRRSACVAQLRHRKSTLGQKKKEYIGRINFRLKNQKHHCLRPSRLAMRLAPSGGTKEIEIHIISNATK